MPRQLWLADVLRAAGVKVVEVGGWRDRGSTTFTPEGLVQHETQGRLTSTVQGEINVLVNGRTGLAGPIAHGLVDRRGTWHITASGRSNHVKTGWAGRFSGKGNSRLLGIEAHHSKDEPWTPTQYWSCVRGFAAICKHKGWTANEVVGHKEHQPGDKIDPGFDMDRFRQDVAAVMNGDDMELDQATKDTLAADTHRLLALLTGQTEARYRVSWTAEERVEPNWIGATLNKLTAAAAEDKTRDLATAGAIQALTDIIVAGGGNADTAAILARIDERATEARQLVEQVHQEEVAHLQQLLAEVARDRDAQVAALQAELDRLTPAG